MPAQVFDMLSYIPLEGDPQGAPPAVQPPGWRERFNAHQKVAGVMACYARAASQVGFQA
jgi:hypothetical protein